MTTTQAQPLAIPDNVVKAATSLLENEYRGNLALAKTVIDWVANYTPPQPTHINKEREDFEVHAYTLGYRDFSMHGADDDKGDGYWLSDCQLLWRGWQARAAVAAQPPARSELLEIHQIVHGMNDLELREGDTWTVARVRFIAGEYMRLGRLEVAATQPAKPEPQAVKGTAVAGWMLHHRTQDDGR